MVYPGCARSLNTAQFTIERHTVGTRTRSVMYSGYDVTFNYCSHLRSLHTLAYAQLAHSISLHRFPSDPNRRQLWIRAFNTQEDGNKMQEEWKDGIKSYMCTCMHAVNHKDGTVIP